MIPSHYDKVMEAVAQAQEERPAIVIVQDEDGNTLYLRHVISEEDTLSFLQLAYEPHLS